MNGQIIFVRQRQCPPLKRNTDPGSIITENGRLSSIRLCSCVCVCVLRFAAAVTTIAAAVAARFPLINLRSSTWSYIIRTRS